MGDLNFASPTTYVHKDLTMRAARDAGLSPSDALALGIAVKNADFAVNTQDPANAHQHAMCTDTNKAVCQGAYNDFRTTQWNAKSLEGVGRFLHAWQDQYAKGHGFKIWDGGKVVGLPDRSHLEGDLYPDPALAQRIIEEAAALIRAYRSFCNNCFTTPKP